MVFPNSNPQLTSRLHSEAGESLLELEDEDIAFEEDEVTVAPSSTMTEPQSVDIPGVWKILIVDDEPDVHRATQLALKSFKFEGKPLVFFSAYSAEEGKQFIATIHSDVALILLDVVMETNDAGLRVVQYIREELNNHQVRIILRTGHPGEAPEESIILNYDINDYKLKVELTRQRLLTATIAALRSYRDLVTLEHQRIELAQTLNHLQHVQSQLQEHAHLLEIKVAERTAALEEANKQLHRLATLDGLTLVANRRRFDEYWQQQWQIVMQQQQPLTLILVDIDYFKAFNDHYGHQAGDECLWKVAQAINMALKRPTDLVARYGGEEFAVVLPYTTLEGGCRIAENIMTEVHTLNLTHDQSLVSDRITLSLGICCVMPRPEISCKTPIAIADKALYQAKQEGRNRFCFCQPLL